MCCEQIRTTTTTVLGLRHESGIKELGLVQLGCHNRLSLFYQFLLFLQILTALPPLAASNTSPRTILHSWVKALRTWWVRWNTQVRGPPGTHGTVRDPSIRIGPLTLSACVPQYAHKVLNAFRKAWFYFALPYSCNFRLTTSSPACINPCSTVKASLLGSTIPSSNKGCCRSIRIYLSRIREANRLRALQHNRGV